jgi:glucose/mannose-6-phosphate isomerase
MAVSMNKLVQDFTKQLQRAIEIGEQAKIGKNRVPLRNILVSGLGGSGIGGTILSNILKDDLGVPIIVNKDYQIPAFVNENTLVVISSYSGNTEETMSALLQAYKKNAHIVCITSGGLIKEYCDTNDIDYIQIDGGMPPRACFGLSFVQQLYIFNILGLLQPDFKQYLQSTINLLDTDELEIQENAKAIALKLQNKIPVIYSDSNFEGVSIRFRQQINENSKMLCWHHVVPEMNHNELVGWTKPNKDMAVVFIRNNEDYERNQERMEFTKEVVSEYCSEIIEIYSKGETDIIRSLYLIHLCDWVTCFLADLDHIDSVEVNVINKLKRRLADNPMS